jgi:hypothetical protein
MRRLIKTGIIAIVFVLIICICGVTQNKRPLKVPHGYISETLLKVAYVVGLVELIDTKPPIPENLQGYEDIVYKKTDNITLKLDL